MINQRNRFVFRGLRKVERKKKLMDLKVCLMRSGLFSGRVYENNYQVICILCYRDFIIFYKKNKIMLGWSLWIENTIHNQHCM